MPTINQVVNAYMACEMLKNKELPFKFSYAIALLERGIEPVFRAYISEEDKYIKEFAKKDENGDVVYGEKGEFYFDNAKDKNSYEEAVKLIREETADIEIKKRKVKPPDNLPPQIISSLLEFIDFDTEDEDA